MPLHVRSVAVNVAVICFFVLSLVGWASGLSPSVCCKRAMIGAVLAYIAGAWATRAINAVLIHAMITNQMNQKTRTGFASNRKITSQDSRRGGRNQ